MKRTQNFFKVFTPAVITYLATSFLLGWLLFLIPLLFHSGEGMLPAVVRLIAWSVAMWAPGLAAIASTAWTENKPLSTLRLGHLGKPLAYLWAWAVPLILILLTAGLTWAAGWGTPEPSMSWLEEQTPELTGATFLPPGQLMTLQIVSAMIVGPLINSLFAVGEEVGWRGFLLPRLLPLGQTRAILVSGIIWGAWHIPAIAQGHNYPGRPLLGIVMMVIFTTLLGFLLAWLYFQTRSPWAPALAHGTVNAAAALPVLFFNVPDLLLGGTLTSAAGLIILGLFALFLYLTRQLPVLS